MSAIATYLTQSGKRRLLRCHTYATHFAETRETVFFALRTSAEKGMMARKMLLVRVALAGIGFVRSVTDATVLAWRKRAASQAAAIHQQWLRTLPVPQGQLDEMGNFLECKHARETDAAGARVPDGCVLVYTYQQLGQLRLHRQHIPVAHAQPLRCIVSQSP